MNPTTASTLAKPRPTNAALERENEELRQRLGEALARENAASELLDVIKSSPGDLSQVFDAMLDKAIRLCEAAFGALFLFTDEGFVLAASRGVPAAYAAFLAENTMLPGPGTAPYRFLKGGERMVIDDTDLVDSDAYRAGDPHRRALVDIGRARSAIQVPLCNDVAALGVVTLYRKEVRPFTDKQIALLQNFAAQAVIAMENGRLIAETREALEQQTATAEILRVISASPTDLQPTFEAIAARAAAVCGAASGGVFRFDGVLIYIGAYHGGAQDELSAIQRAFPMPPGNGSITARAVMAKEIVHSTNVGEDDGGVRAALAEVFRTVMSVPMLRDGKVLGAITVTRRQIQPFSGAQIELLKTFADQAVIAIENVRLFNETREALEQQTATAEVLGAINLSPGELAPVFDTVVASALRLCRADHAGIYRNEGNEYRWVAGHLQSPEYERIERTTVIRPGTGSLVGRVALEGRVVQILDALEDPLYEAKGDLRTAGAHSLLGVPLLRGAETIGVIGLGRNRIEAFTEGDVSLVTAFADQAVVAIENARLITETREALEQQTATAEVLGVINTSPGDLAPVFDAMLEKAMRLCGAAFGQLHTYDGEGFPTAALRGLPAAYAEYQAKNPPTYGPGTAPWRIVQGEDVVHIVDLTKSEAYRAGDPARRATVDLGGCHTLLTVALRREDALLGTVSLYRQEARPFTDKQIALLQNFAAQAVIAMENARLLTETQERSADLQEALGYQTVTSDVLQVISRSTFDLQPVLDTLVQTAARLCVADGAGMTLREGEVYRYVAVSDLTSDFFAFLRQHPFVPGRDTMAGRIALGGVIVHIDDITIDPEYDLPEAFSLGGIRTMLGVPLLRDGAVVGTFSLIRRRVEPFTQRQIELVKTFADQAVIAIENARLITETREARDDAEAAYCDLQAAQASLVQAQKMAALGQLTAGIAHEIKNPLNFVNNFASLSVELLEELKDEAEPALTALDDDTRAGIDETLVMLSGNLEKIAEHGQRADNIVKSMLEHSRGVAGERREVDLNGVIEEALNLAYHGARAHDQSFNITLERDYAKGLKPIELAPQEMTRVFLNLFGNGFYAANKRARDNGDGSFRPVLTVQTREEGGTIEVRVRDNGTGIPPDIKDKLFQPFFTTKPTGEGTGLGLSISYDIVTQQHGGTITVESEPGSYTEFTVRLPRQ